MLYFYIIAVPLDLNIKMKAVMIGAVFLIVSMFVVKEIMNTPQPLYNTVVGVQSRNRVS